jgi:hypothetical protein
VLIRAIFTGLILLTGSLASADGVIEGFVVNATRGHEVSPGTNVVLRARLDGEFVVMASTTTQADGSFRFIGLPLDCLYLPGANQDDVHFPGPRVSLNADRPYATVRLKVFESVSETNPLVIESLEIVVQAEPGCLKVRETMLIDNPSSQCYVGSPRHPGGGPVTLELGIPANFERITFDKEAFGRQFKLINDKLITGIPWPPGKRELAFAYVIANETGNRTWQRRIDLPCSRVSMNVKADKPENVVCNLPVMRTRGKEEACFQSNAQRLPAGHRLKLELDHLPMSTMVYARRVASVLLMTLVAAVSVVSVRRRSKV